MTLARVASVADRRSLLATRAELDRTRLSLAMHEVRAIVVPPPDPARAAAVRPAVAMLIGLAVPAVGVSRLGRWLRIASIALAAWRVARDWRARR